MISPRRLSVIALSLALGGLVAGVTLFALIAFDVLPDLSPLWIGIAVLVTEIPALALAVPVRGERLGSPALILATSILAITAAGLILLAPAGISQSPAATPSVEAAANAEALIPETNTRMEV